jgi:excisionase family DNA binding protein
MLTVAHMSLQPAETAPSEPDYYTVAEFAAKLRVDARTVYELIASGQLRTVRVTRASGRRGTHRIPRDWAAEYEAKLRDGNRER